MQYTSVSNELVNFVIVVNLRCICIQQHITQLYQIRIGNGIVQRYNGNCTLLCKGFEFDCNWYGMHCLRNTSNSCSRRAGVIWSESLENADVYAPFNNSPLRWEFAAINIYWGACIVAQIHPESLLYILNKILHSRLDLLVYQYTPTLFKYFC